MKKHIGLIFGVVFMMIFIVKFDIFIYPTLDYFGKYVAVGVLNIFPFIVAIGRLESGFLYGFCSCMCHKRFKDQFETSVAHDII